MSGTYSNVRVPKDLRLTDQVTEFMKAAAKITVALGKGCRDIVRQSVVREDSYIARKLGKVSYLWRNVGEPFCERLGHNLRFFNQYLPKDKNPLHSWLVIFFVSLIAFSALKINTEQDTSPVPLMKKVYLHPTSANLIVLPDGRYLAYKEQGVSTERARYSMIAPYTFLSSRLAGIPELKASLLEEFGIRLITYDLPAFGESDPHPKRNLESSAIDMLLLANVVGVNDKFWVVGYLSGSNNG